MGNRRARYAGTSGRKAIHVDLPGQIEAWNGNDNYSDGWQDPDIDYRNQPEQEDDQDGDHSGLCEECGEYWDDLMGGVCMGCRAIDSEEVEG